ncbi:Hypothetical predicted protein [Lecanosticta acicola]|uniref:Plasmid pRiA4b Orf3-like domain-containing protein n=1 Tax=Lecanosticta acicola TaxID=111012 RepID=A0AAI9E9D7_9PEZI|nr:Hypothetical predicted protein [Lecanosticta acicola]
MLFDVFGKAQYRDKPFQYVYDLGDNWEHDLKILGTAPSTDKIICLDGEGHPIAEDAGCHQGWQDVLDAYRAATPTREQREKKTWFARQASNADPQGLGDGRDRLWDRERVARRLEALA